ncbi:hypothetical protein [Marinimicrobium agarilyticum]|uniref:hypothetical protein n=1 Tax=Marinimicrobium agarilyticum TaxID=306546 RepID=UPI000409D493|nr:hypothetical protein [Marinimicrobium agarilyticum]
MTSLSDDRELEHRLARELQQAAEYIDDDGFTDQVMLQLPTEPARRPRALWLWSLLMIALLAGAGAWLIIPVQPLTTHLTVVLMEMPLLAWLQIGLGLSVLAVTGTGYWVWREVAP